MCVVEKEPISEPWHATLAVRYRVVPTLRHSVVPGWGDDCLTLDDFPQWLAQQEIEK